MLYANGYPVGGGGSSGGGSITELWENSNPQSVGTFTVTINNLSNYSFIGIIFQQKDDESTCTPMEIIPNNIGESYPIVRVLSTGESRGRTIEITSATVLTFSDGYNPGTGYTSNRMIPVKVYGI